MIRAIFYKEYLKTRWFSLSILAMFFVFLIQIELVTSYHIRQQGSEVIWYNIIFRNYLFYYSIKFLPMLSALIFGLAQFIPEIMSNRLKLTLHLPLKEPHILILMLLFGTASLFLIYLIVILGLMILTLGTFPVQVWNSVFNTVIPWFWAGISTYWVVTIATIETRWIRRGGVAIIGYGYLTFLFSESGYNQYLGSIFLFILLGLMLAPGILYSGERFRRGMQ